MEESLVDCDTDSFRMERRMTYWDKEPEEEKAGRVLVQLPPADAFVVIWPACLRKSKKVHSGR